MVGKRNAVGLWKGVESVGTNKEIERYVLLEGIPQPMKLNNNEMMQKC